MANKLNQKGITLLGAGVDELPEAYKSIHKVMSDQKILLKS